MNHWKPLSRDKLNWELWVYSLFYIFCQQIAVTAEHAFVLHHCRLKYLLFSKERKGSKLWRDTLSNFFQSFVIKSEFKDCQLPRVLKHKLIKKLHSVFCVLEIILNHLFSLYFAIFKTLNVKSLLSCLGNI